MNIIKQSKIMREPSTEGRYKKLLGSLLQNHNRIYQNKF